MPKELIIKDAETMRAEEPGIEERLRIAERRIYELKDQMVASNQWADRWAREQVVLGQLVQHMQQRLLSDTELGRFRVFMDEFNKFLKD